MRGGNSTDTVAMPYAADLILALHISLTNTFVIWFVMFTNNRLPLLLKIMLNEGACLTFPYTLHMMKCRCFCSVKTNDIMSAFRSSTICKTIAFVFCQALLSVFNDGV